MLRTGESMKESSRGKRELPTKKTWEKSRPSRDDKEYIKDARSKQHL